MSDNSNIELLATIHNLKASSSDAQLALALAITHAENGSVKISIGGACAIQAVLALQNKVITGLTEQNQVILERVNDFIIRLEGE